MAEFGIVDLSGDEWVKEERKKIDAALGVNLSNATGNGYYAIQAARLIIKELRVLSIDLRDQIRRIA